MNPKNFPKVLTALVVVASLSLGILVGAQQFSESSTLAVVQLLPAPKKLPEFSLEDHRGQTFSRDHLGGKWSLVFFGFTSCPDYCPLELQKLGKLLSVMGAGDAVQVVFVSVDPERDGREKLANYVSFFHPQIIGVRGDNTQLAQFAQFFGAAYDRSAILDGKLLTIPAGINMPTNVTDHYQVNHSTRIFVINPSGEYVGNFSSPYDVNALVPDMNLLMDR